MLLLLLLLMVVALLSVLVLLLLLLLFVVVVVVVVVALLLLLSLLLLLLLLFVVVLAVGGVIVVGGVFCVVHVVAVAWFEGAVVLVISIIRFLFDVIMSAMGSGYGRRSGASCSGHEEGSEESQGGQCDEGHEEVKRRLNR